MIAYDQFKENWQQFCDLIDNLPSDTSNPADLMVQKYIEHHVNVLNEVLVLSIEYFKKLSESNSSQEIICQQAQLINDISKKMSLSLQRFMNASLDNISDYNEWLKTHCDLATD